MEYFIYPFLLDAQERYVLWFTDDVDGVLTHDDGNIAVFLSVEAASAFAKDRALPVASKVSSALDLQWITQDFLTSNNLDCVKTLDAWNFFVDVAASLLGKANPFIGLDKRAGTYEKVFWGNNLPAVTPHGERFEPIWSQYEITEIKLVLMGGLELFASNLREVPSYL